jgi:hypothetical protein
MGDAATSAARTRTSRVTDPSAGNASFVITVAHPQPPDGYVTVSRKLMYGRIWQLLGNVNSTSFELTFSSRNVIVAVSPRAIVDGLICASKRTAIAGDGADGASPHAMTDPARSANAVSRNDEFSIITSSSRALIMTRWSPSDAAVDLIIVSIDTLLFLRGPKGFGRSGTPNGTPLPLLVVVAVRDVGLTLDPAYASNADADESRHVRLFVSRLPENVNRVPLEHVDHPSPRCLKQ